MIEACRGVDRSLDVLFSRAEGLLATIAKLGTAARFLLKLAGDIHLISLNALIASSRLEVGGAGLSVVTEDLARMSQECTVKIDAMAAQLRDLSSSLGDTAFSVSAAKLQVEMIGYFLHELAHEDQSEADPATDERIRGDMATLVASLLASTEQLVAALPRAQAPIPRLMRLQHELEIDLRRLASVPLLGAIQAVGIPEEAMFRELLDRIVTQLHRADIELDNLSSGVGDLRTHLPAYERTAHDACRAAAAFQGAGVPVA